MSDEKKTGLALLRVPFPEHQVGVLPKPYKKESPKGKCNECGGWHGLPAAHLSYVGHAAITDRLLEADPNWTWEPLALDKDGLPALDQYGGLWIKLRVCDVVRLGYGSCEGRTGGNAIKELIGDALRNAGMRFGLALDLWHKGDLHGDDEEEKPKPRRTVKVQEPVDLMDKSPATAAIANAPLPEHVIAKMREAESLTELHGLESLVRNAPPDAGWTPQLKAEAWRAFTEKRDSLVMGEKADDAAAKGAKAAADRERY